MNNEASHAQKPKPANGMSHLPEYLLYTALSDQVEKGTVDMNCFLRIDSLMWPMPEPPSTTLPDPAQEKRLLALV
jgi:hypothetical protein